MVWLRLFSDVNCNHQATHPTLEHFNYNSRGHSTEKLLIISRNFELIYILFTFWEENIIEFAPAGNETVKNSWSRHTLHSSKHSSSDHVRRLLLFDKCFRRFSSTSLDDDVYTSLRFVGAQLSIVDLSKGQSFCEASRGERTEQRSDKVMCDIPIDGQRHSINQLAGSRLRPNLFAFNLRHRQQSFAFVSVSCKLKNVSSPHDVFS